MASKKLAPYGTWSSPISAETTSTALLDVVVDSITSTVYHIEGRPSEGGRCVLVESHSGREIVGKDANVRTAVHEYGGAAAIVNDGIAYYSNLSDGRLYRVSVKAGSEAEAVTPESKPYRYACFDIHPKNPNFLVSILEDHTIDVPSSVINTLCIIDTNTKTIKPLVSGADFYAFPRFSPDGTRFAWQQWNNPNMPWDATEIRLAEVEVQADAFTLANTTTIAGADHDCSNAFLSWANETTLLWISDKSGFFNPWKYVTNTKTTCPVLSTPVPEDFAKVMWSLSMFPYAVIGVNGEFATFAAFRDGRVVLYLVNIETGEKKEMKNPYVNVESMRTLAKSQGRFAFLGAKVDEAEGLVIGSIDISIVSDAETDFATVNPPDEKSIKLDPSLVSVPRGIPLRAPPNNDLLHVIYYAPHNPNYGGSSKEDEKPPCIVNVHGGPTGMAMQGLNRTIQYFTSRGWAWLDVNYGGSFGYGREYISRLDGEWGVVDVEDCIKATRILSQPPYSFIDPARTVIRGSSSGGLTVLLALSHSSDVRAFAAGTSLYGVTDLVGLAEMTHKFEAQYDAKLIGGSLEQEREKHVDRSPVNHADNIVRPLLILQGDIDRVVPKEKAEAIYESVKRRGGIVEYKLYPGEGHGWRREETQKDALKRELAFYERVLLEA